MEEKFELVELMNTLAISKASNNEVMDLEQLYRLFAQRYGKENPVKAPVRERIYEQKIQIKPRAKTYWEAPKDK